MQIEPEKITDKKIAEIFQDLEKCEAYMYVITRNRIYQFDPESLTHLFIKYCRKSIPTDDVGVPLLFDGDDEENWVRWQNRGDL
jgi:hypothetical protein